MNRDRLFWPLDKNDPFRTAKEYFNHAAMVFNFDEALGYLRERIGYGDEYTICFFPEDIDGTEEAFEGVKFRYLEDELIVSDETFANLLDDAAENFRKFV